MGYLKQNKNVDILTRNYIAHSLVVWEAKGSILGPNSVISQVSNYNYTAYVKCVKLIECLGPKQAQLITMHSSDFQTNVVQLKGWWSTIVEI